MKRFNLEAAKTGKPICTRDGKSARIICWDMKGIYPIVALVKTSDQNEYSYNYKEDGTFLIKRIDAIL